MASPPDLERLKREIRREVEKALGGPVGSSHAGALPAGLDLVTERDVADARRGARLIQITPRAIITPLAREAAERYGVRIVSEQRRPAEARPAAPAAALPAAPPPASRRPLASPLSPGSGNPVVLDPRRASSPRIIAVASDHAGHELKSAVRSHLEFTGYQVLDLGVDSASTSVDYPDFIIPAAVAVARGQACRAILFDCHGNASAMTANKVPGVRAAAGRTAEEVDSSREHNDINALCLGQKILSAAEACALVDRFLSVAFAGDRHARRIGKVTAVERAFCDGGLS